MYPPTSPITLDIQAISGIAGSVSLACWVVVFSPQIIENFRRSSAEGLSIRFVFVWLTGDVFNILGAVLQGVLPTMIILACYYAACDIVLLSQCFYYKGFTLRDEVTHTSTSDHDQPTQPTSESTALLANNTTPHHTTLLDGGQHLSPAVPLHGRRDDAVLKQAPSPPRSLLKAFFVNLTAVLVVCAAGVLGWYLSVARHQGHDHDSAPRPDEETLHFNTLGQIFGYICAALYLSSRVPQLLLNYRRKSTDGISMLFFLFACVGNLTYVLSIFAFDPVCHRPGKCRPGEAGAIYARYIAVNASWLLGSFGTFCLDLGVFAQYFTYRRAAVDAAAS